MSLTSGIRPDGQRLVLALLKQTSRQSPSRRICSQHRPPPSCPDAGQAPGNSSDTPSAAAA
jgi:hypothetical protein